MPEMPIPFDDMDMGLGQPLPEDLEAPQPDPQHDDRQSAAEKPGSYRSKTHVHSIEHQLKISISLFQMLMTSQCHHRRNCNVYARSKLLAQKSSLVSRSSLCMVVRFEFSCLLQVGLRSRWCLDKVTELSSKDIRHWQSSTHDLPASEEEVTFMPVGFRQQDAPVAEFGSFGVQLSHHVAANILKGNDDKGAQSSVANDKPPEQQFSAGDN